MKSLVSTFVIVTLLQNALAASEFKRYGDQSVEALATVKIAVSGEHGKESVTCAVFCVNVLYCDGFLVYHGVNDTAFCLLLKGQTVIM